VITMVCFHAAGAAYCLPVGSIRAVLRSSGMIALPAPHPDVAGIVPGDPPLTVIAPLGAGGTHILVVETGEQTFGLQVDTVTGLRRVDAANVHPAPHGQNRELISGTIDAWGELVMVADADALGARL
jgi:chemotaxis signal transduction protein